MTNSLQEDLGLGAEASAENGELRKSDAGEAALQQHQTEEAIPEEAPNEVEEANEEPSNNSNINVSSNNKGTTEPSNEATSRGQSEEIENRREFDLPEGGGHSFTPRPGAVDTIDPGSTEKTTMMSTISSHNQPQDGGGSDMEAMSQSQSEMNEGTTGGPSGNQQLSPEMRSGIEEPAEETSSSKEDEALSSANDEDKVKSLLGKIKKLQQDRKSNDESTASNSNESKDKSENNTDEIQVRNLIQESSKFASGSSVSPYEALHIYGIQTDGPINKIVFEGGEPHRPRPLTIKESNHLKEFIKMVISTNRMHSPMASFPNEGEEAAPRSGFGGNQKKKSPWADKPVPLELV